MARYYDDKEIDRLIKLPKELPEKWDRRLRNLKSGPDVRHSRSNLLIPTHAGLFKIAIRQSTIEKDDFSILLIFLGDERDNQSFRLRRYNGLHPPLGVHKNRIEKTRIRGFHVHKATLRYQLRTPKEEGYAELTNAYVDVWSALDAMISECGFIKPQSKPTIDPKQRNLFE